MKYVFEDFNIEHRTKKVILSAPHCYPQLRNGIKKKAETKTGILVKNVSKAFNCSCIYKTKFYNNDPNWDETSTYRDQLVDFILANDIKLLFDIHGMSSKRDVDICISSNNGKNILNRFDICDGIKSCFESCGFKNVFIDNPFNASGLNVISSYVSRTCNIPCFQIEINTKFLFSTFPDYNYDQVASTIENILENIYPLLYK